MSEIQTSLVDRFPKAIVLIIFMAMFFIIDFSLGRILNPNVAGIHHSYYHHDLKKNYCGEIKWGSNKYSICTNSLGFKDKENRDIPLETTKYRILFLGDSFTEGLGYPYDKTFVGLIDKSIDNDKIDILNAGVASYSPKLYYLKLKYLVEISKLKLDRVIVFIDISDTQDEIVYQSYYPGKVSWKERVGAFLRNQSPAYRALRPYISELNNYLEKILGTPSGDEFYENHYQDDRSSWTYDSKVFDKWGRKGLALAGNSMDEINNLCKKNNIELSIAIYPWPDQISNNDINSIQVEYWERFSKSRGIKFVNYFPLFIGDKPPSEVIDKYFTKGDVHWNEEGHKLIAATLLSSELHGYVGKRSSQVDAK